MSQFASFDPARLVLSQPTCPQCGAKMWLVRIEPDDPGHETHNRLGQPANPDHARSRRQGILDEPGEGARQQAG